MDQWYKPLASLSTWLSGTIHQPACLYRSVVQATSQPLYTAEARFPFKHMQHMQYKCLRCVKNRIDSIIVFSCARTACVSCMTWACILLFFACVFFAFIVFLAHFLFCLRTFSYARPCVRLNGNRAEWYNPSTSLPRWLSGTSHWPVSLHGSVV